MICKKCRGEIPSGSAFCNHCGAPQGNAPPKKPTKKPVRHRSGGTGTIRFQKGRNLPYAAYLPKGAGRIYLGSFATSQEASDALLAAIGSRPKTPRAMWTVRQFWEAYIASDEFVEQTHSAQNALRAAWKYLAPVADLRMIDVKGAAYQGCIKAAAEAGKSKSTCTKIRVVISAICKEAMKDDVIPQNYASILSVRGEAPREKDILSADEIALIRAHDDDIRARFVLIMIYTGMRIGEISAMLREDVYLDEGYMIGGEKTQAGKRRIMPILPCIAEYVAGFYADGGERLITVSGKAPSITFLRRRWFYDFLVELGILTAEEVAVGGTPRLTPHCTRKTFASLAREAKIEPDVLKRVIGHTDYSLTDEVYIKMQAEFLRGELSQMDAGNGNGTPKA